MTVLTDFHSGTEYQDRYEFHPADSELWLRLFMYADGVHPDLAAHLMWIRNTGAVLVPSDKYGYIIRPVIGVQGWSTQMEYDTERKPLVKWQGQIIQILGRLAKCI